jgi:hypothetical protein
MKKTISLIGIMVMLLGIVLFTLPAADGGIDTSYNGDDGSGGSGGTTLWVRLDLICPDKIHEKTTCDANGLEQCTAQYCTK